MRSNVKAWGVLEYIDRPHLRKETNIKMNRLICSKASLSNWICKSAFHLGWVHNAFDAFRNWLDPHIWPQIWVSIHFQFRSFSFCLVMRCFRFCLRTFGHSTPMFLNKCHIRLSNKLISAIVLPCFYPSIALHVQKKLPHAFRPGDTNSMIQNSVFAQDT